MEKSSNIEKVDLEKQAQIVYGRKLLPEELQEMKENVFGVCKFILKTSKK